MTMYMVRACAAHPYFIVILAFLYLRLLYQAGIFFLRTRECVPRIRGVKFSPEKGWSLQKGRGTQMPSLFLSALSITRLVAPHRNTCGVEVFPEYFYIFFELAPLSCRARFWSAVVLLGNWYYMQSIILSFGALRNAHRGWREDRGIIALCDWLFMIAVRFQ
jgi:hypothetical protein